MYCGGLNYSQLFETELGLDADSLSKTFAKIKVNRIGGDVHQSDCSKRSPEVFCAPLVRFVSISSAHRRLGIVLQKEIRPLPERQGFTPSYDLKKIRISRLKSFSESPICFLPISGLA
jgi:hypothetical protein